MRIRVERVSRCLGPAVLPEAIGPLEAGLEIEPRQLATLERLLAAGFKFVTHEQVERYLEVEKGGFAAPLEPIAGEFRIFRQIGYRMGDSMGMLMERGDRQVFVYHETVVEATPEMLEACQHFRAELQSLLGEGREQ